MLRRLFLLALAALSPLPASDLTAEAARWWNHVAVLADDRLEGRDTGSPGHLEAARYVAQEFERAGLKPAGTSGYLQAVSFLTRRIDEANSRLALVRAGREHVLKLGEEANFVSRFDLASSVEAPAVFVGYGLHQPDAGHDDLAGADLRGKIAVYLSGGPSSLPGPLRAHAQSWAERWKALREAGAVGTISIANPRTMDVPWSRSAPARLKPSMVLEGAGFDDGTGLSFSAVFNPQHAGLLFEGAPHSFAELLKIADAGKALPSFPLPVTVRARASLDRGKAESHNVAAVLPGNDPKLRTEYVVLSAHLDHVGVGAAIAGDSIYNGAMDNAAGVASLIEIARLLRNPERPLQRSVLLVAVTGEEKGLQGSRYFANRPTVKPESMVANLNLDMYLPIHPLRSIAAPGLNESSLGDQLRAAAEGFGISAHPDPEPDRNLFIRSDQYSFIRRGIPALFFKFGYAPGSPEERLQKEWIKTRYHAPSDDLKQPVDREAAALFNRVIAELTVRVANDPERPRWKPDSFFRRFAP